MKSADPSQLCVSLRSNNKVFSDAPLPFRSRCFKMEHLSQLCTLMKFVCSNACDSAYKRCANCCLNNCERTLYSTTFEKHDYAQSVLAHAAGYLMMLPSGSDTLQIRSKMLGRSAALVILITCEIKVADANTSLTWTSTEYEISRR